MTKERVACFSTIAMILFSAVGLALGAAVLPKMTDDQTLTAGQVVYVENDGRCDAGMVVKITSGNMSLASAVLRLRCYSDNVGPEPPTRV